MTCSFCDSLYVIAHCDRCEVSCCIRCIAGMDDNCECCHVGIEDAKNCDWVDSDGVGHVKECENCNGSDAVGEWNDELEQFIFAKGVISDFSKMRVLHCKN